MEPVVLRSARLTLSTPTADDVDAITSCCQDEAVQAWTTVPSPYKRADAEHYVGEVVTTGWAAGTSCTWGIRMGDNTTLIGMINCFGIADRGGEIGFWLSKFARGGGVMSEAVDLVCDFAFAVDGLALQRVQWHARTGNAASATVARRAGFQFEGTARLGGSQRGVRADSWSAALLSTDERRPADGWPAETLVPRHPSDDSRAG